MSLTKATYSMINGASWNVLDYGADPTGVADSAPAILAAIAAAKAGQGEFTMPIVEFPKGTYKLNSEILIKEKPVHLIGNGATIKASTSNAFVIGEFSNPGPEYQTNVIIENLVLYGFPGNPSYTSKGSGTGIVVEDSSGLMVRDCFVWGFQNGIYIIGGLVATFENVQVRTNVVGVNAVTGTFSAPNFINFLNCKFFENDQVWNSNSGQFYLQNCDVENNNPQNLANIVHWNMTGLSGIAGTNCLIMENVHCENNPCLKEVYLSFSDINKAASFRGCLFGGPSTNYGMQVANGNVELTQTTIWNATLSGLFIDPSVNAIKDRSSYFISVGGTTTNYYKELPNGIQINQVTWTSGSGTPEGAITAPVGSLYTRTNGGANTTLYVKESGTGNTGWIAK